MNLTEIKRAIEEGRNVNWSSEAYEVIKDEKGQYLIKGVSNGHCIGLTHQDGETLNGDELDFYTNGGRIKLVVVEDHTLGYIDPRTPYTVNVFKRSVLRGAIFDMHENPVDLMYSDRKVSLATWLDFKAMGQSFSNSYLNEAEYEYDKTNRLNVKNLPYHNYIPESLINENPHKP